MMGFYDSRILPCLVLLVLFPTWCTNTQDYVSSKATYYGSPVCPGNPRGACGYGELGITANDGNVAAVSRLYNGGTGCGACYQVRCKAPGGVCKEEGVKVVATDHGAGPAYTDFILSTKAYSKMAKSGSEAELIACGVVDIEFRRIPCDANSLTSNANLLIRIHEFSYYPHYLAIVLIYNSGSIYDVHAAEIWQDDCKQWRPMRKPFGAAWDIENPPKGDLKIRFKLVNSNNYGDSKWVESAKPIPDRWQAGAVLDAGVQLA